MRIWVGRACNVGARQGLTRYIGSHFGLTHTFRPVTHILACHTLFGGHVDVNSITYNPFDMCFLT